MTLTQTDDTTLAPDKLLDHWQGHRRLTRRVIEAFPEGRLFSFTAGGMRPFGLMALEVMGMAIPTVRGIVTGEWEWPDYEDGPRDKRALLAAWEEVSTRIEQAWEEVTPERLRVVDTAFGQWPGQNIEMILYLIDNEVHHRGQGYVYLRLLGIEPPPFWER